MAGLIELREVSFEYKYKKEKKIILNQVNYTFEKGIMYAVVGRSGAGKTTTLSLLGSLDRPTKGNVCYDGKDLEEIGYSEYRRRYVGIVFQEYNLLSYFSVLDNVTAAMEITGMEKAGRKKRAEELLKRVGIEEALFQKKVTTLSGGEQQRVAIARAVAKDAELLLADEPTGNLDDETSEQIIELLKRLAHEEKRCVIIVTHSRNVVEQADKVLRLEKGILKEELA